MLTIFYKYEMEQPMLRARDSVPTDPYRRRARGWEANGRKGEMAPHRTSGRTV
ncbi:hypothetical protein [Phocaeicola abscessus]|uniref:hypothetical protein n=1 Tax=Phocaeicola abscessus TaxID=555313 RepID=UPI0012EE1DE3|nr:hypothetical protein [Phocaeicola abscessus]